MRRPAAIACCATRECPEVVKHPILRPLKRSAQRQCIFRSTVRSRFPLDDNAVLKSTMSSHTAAASVDIGVTRKSYMHAKKYGPWHYHRATRGNKGPRSSGELFIASVTLCTARYPRSELCGSKAVCS